MIGIKLTGNAVLKTPAMLAIFISVIPITIGALEHYEDALNTGLFIFLIGALMHLNDNIKEVFP